MVDEGQLSYDAQENQTLESLVESYDNSQRIFLSTSYSDFYSN